MDLISYFGGSTSFQSLHKENWTLWKPISMPEEDRWPFESVDTSWWYQFQHNYWYLPALVIFSYWASISLLTLWMKGRPPIKNQGLRTAMVLQNLMASIFAFLVLYRASSFLLRMMEYGPDWFHRSLCFRTNLSNNKDMFWVIGCGWSKIFHLADTYFLILQKKPVPFFHIYHHTAMVTLPMLIFPFGEPAVYWYGFINMVQHLFTYPILLLKSLKFRLPRQTGTFLLLVELIQMAVGLYIGLYTAYVLKNGGFCIRHPKSITFFNFLYFTFGLLVLKMIYDTMSHRSKSKKLKDL